jgi:hypothetical protein
VGQAFPLIPTVLSCEVVYDHGDRITRVCLHGSKQCRVSQTRTRVWNGRR